MNRIKASLIHLLGSACVLSLIFILVRWIWYPGPLFDVAAGVDLIVILISADLILGPLITLIIFNPKKKSLKFDIACVLVCQIAFMLYGVWAIFSARPVYVAFVEKRFYLVTANEIDPEDQKKAKNPIFQSMPLFGPEIVGVKPPDDAKVKGEISWANLYGMGAQHLPQYFVSYDEISQTVKATGKTAKDLIATAKFVPKEELDRLVEYESKKRAEGKPVVFLPLLNKKKILNMAVDASTGTVVEML